jgi:hypothetical protein
VVKLLVPVCVSNTHIAFGSIRMEPVFMLLGESAAIEASLAIDGDSSVQNVPYAKLRERLLVAGQDPRLYLSCGPAGAIMHRRAAVLGSYETTGPHSTVSLSVEGMIVGRRR